MPFVIPATGIDPRFALSVPLDGVDFSLAFAWNTRDERWYMDVYDADENPLAVGVPLVVDVPLLQKYATDGMPAGWLIAYDATGRGNEIADQEDLGVRVQLMYLSQAEVEAL